jgi:hypothetical protein
MPAAVVAVAGMAAGAYVAGTVAGLAAGSLMYGVVSGVTSMVTSSLIGGIIGSDEQPQDQQSPAEQAARGVLVNTAGTTDPLLVLYGTRRVGGTRVLTESSGDSNTYLHVVIAHCEGEIDGVDAVYFDNTISTDARFAGAFTLEHALGADTQAASAALIAALPSVWTSAHKLSGVAYTYARLTYNQDVWHGLPVITADLRGRKVYDPRDLSTAWSDNPALCLRDYLTNARYGRGIASALIDDTALIAAANYCDATITTPAGTQKRYTCNGLIDTSRNSIENVRLLLSCMRGMLVFSGGLYKLVLDKADTAAFAFTEDNITGAWTIKLADKRSRYNRVRANWINPDNEWQADIALAESTTYRSTDNSLMLEDRIELPFTTDPYEAQLLAQRHLKQSRFGIIASFRATIAGLGCEVGDVVSITHSTPGWAAKDFRVVRIGLLPNDEVEVTAVEYDDSVYTADPLTTPRTSVVTNLPDPYTVAAPGTPDVTETLFETTGSAGVKARATMSWAAVTDAFHLDYLPEYRIAAGAWVVLPATAGTSIDINDIAPGSYEFRLRQRNTMGIHSGYSGTRAKEILGLTAAPAVVSGFYVIKSGGFGKGTWNLHPDLDVRQGGSIVVRHSPLTVGAEWDASVVVETFAGNAVSGDLALMTGTYMAKAIDSTGHYSDTCVNFVATEGMVTGWTTVGTVTFDPGFAGSLTNLGVIDNTLRLVSAEMFDDAEDIDSSEDIDGGAIAASGEADFSSVLDLTTVAVRRVQVAITAQAFDVADYIDGADDMDSNEDIDGSAINDCDATIYCATTPDDPAGSPVWSAWQPFFVADFEARAMKFRIGMTSGLPSHALAVSALSVSAKVPA